ncbi:response regulator FixJ [Maricaulis sp.]|uniref:response regulator FixJ n=1 Tax=Maricaulis sp. TaxID=1486257 RepID=UPI001B08AA5F|nr:response regulator FixJ [Maricaulis sp.]MBO6763854.1 response regulator [Maricaulis sp.]
MSDRQRVHVIDDDEAMRDSLAFLLGAASLDVTGHASAEGFLEELPDTPPGCVVTDARMPGLSGIDLLLRLQEIDDTLPVIVITGHSDVPMAVKALKAGAFDFIEKPFDDSKMIQTVRDALAYRSDAERRKHSREAAAGLIEALTARERQVFDGLVAGRPNKVIAHDLGISARTVEIYRANVMSKLDASSLSDVVRIAFVARGPDL